MQSKILISVIISIFTVLNSSCSKKSDSSSTEHMQAAIDNVNAKNDDEVQKIKENFDKVSSAVNSAHEITDKALDEFKKSTLNFVNKLVRVDILNLDGSSKSSYFEMYELDIKTGNYKPKFASLYYSEAAGVCLSLTSPTCETTFSFKDLIRTQLTTNSGRFKVVETSEKQFSNVPDINLTSQIKIIETIPDQMTLELGTQGILNSSSLPMAFNTKIRISAVGKLSDVTHKFGILTEDKSERKDVLEVTEDLKKLSKSVVQIIIDSSGTSILNGGGTSQGTGFFVSDSGLLLTNNHVIDGAKECFLNFICKIKLRQINEKNESKTVILNARLLVTDANMDFALLKVDLTPEISIEALEIEDKEVGSDLITLGYPGDRKNPKGETPLSYSQGKLTGTFDLGYSTSMYIFHGASGSPALNFSNKRIIGIISNGNTPVPGEDGAPGIARPIQMINAKFGITDYINGTKQERITSILKMLKVSSNLNEATAAISAFDKELTLLGLPIVKSIMLNHDSSEVRTMILKYLNQRQLILGSEIE